MTAAPAPSPNKIHVPLSFQLTILDRHSTPINNAFFESPALICPAAIWYATINPEHAAFKSNAAAFTAPSFFWTLHAVHGKSCSEETLDTIRRSISSAVIPASSNAFSAATAAIETAVSFPTICRLLIPVRLWIHSSFVSTNWEIAALSSTFSGRQEPVPFILTNITLSFFVWYLPILLKKHLLVKSSQASEPPHIWYKWFSAQYFDYQILLFWNIIILISYYF